MLKECNAKGKKSGFKPMETLQAVILTADEWTPESGLVTAAQKIQRSKIAKKFDHDIKVCSLLHSLCLRFRSFLLSRVAGDLCPAVNSVSMDLIQWTIECHPMPSFSIY